VYRADLRCVLGIHHEPGTLYSLALSIIVLSSPFNAL
jgi:hypothetical protein